MTKEKSSNTIQAMWVGMGSLSSFLFSIVSAAILCRFLSKAEYGTYKQVMYVYNTLLVVFTLGLPKAYGYFLPRYKREEGKHVERKLNFCFVCMGGLFSVVIYFSSYYVSVVLNNPDLSDCLKIFSPAPLFLLPTMGLDSTMSVYSMSKYSAFYMIVTRIFVLICTAFPVAFYQANVHVALWGFSISSFLSCLLAFYIKSLPFKNNNNIKSSLTYKQIFSFSMPLMYASIWAIAIKSADQFFVSRWFGQNVFAEFSNGSLELPFVQMVLGAGGVVLLPVFSRHVAEGGSKQDILDLWMKVTEKAALIIYPLIIYCWTFAPLIMTFLYGDQYETSAIYFRIMLLVNFFTIAQFYPIMIAIGATGYYAKVHLLTALLIWILEYICVISFSSAYYITAISVACNVFKMYLMIRYIANYMEIKTREMFPVKRLFLIFVSCLLSAGTVALVFNTFFSNGYKMFCLVFSFVAFSIVTYFSSKLFSIDYLVVVEPFLKKLKGAR